MTTQISNLSSACPEPVSAMAQALPSRKPDPVRQDAVAVLSAPGRLRGTGSAWESAVLAEINENLKLASIGVEFEFDSGASIIIARVVDVETGKLIRQMPSEEVMQLSKALGRLHDLLVHQAICRKAQATDNSQAPAPARWSSPWRTAARGQEAGAFKSVQV